MPLGESMISSLKSNNSIKLDKSSRFRKTLGGYNKNRKVEFDFPEANNELLEQIRHKTRRDSKRQEFIFVTFFLLFFLLAVMVVYYYDVL
ncbi:hypothetical protein [Psychroserpens sp. SPM9]|uniref:hypothetical protein n=1 Tax=Psychroserpens sp. SPM9 TaxID=2975598 RepID=UPI0021A63578|nr:hypothetical protein [Psychroserpens sp. SPM9]MDG5490100.1 hypothetical protein [Psychroserpens sp. SPM9]